VTVRKSGKSSETGVRWPPLVPFKGAQVIVVANLWEILWKPNCMLSLLQLYRGA